MANAASESRTRPSSKAYRDNYDAIFKKPKPKKITTRELGKLGFAMYGIK
jgi:hypothetical protein